MTLLAGDCLDAMKTLPDASADSVVTDPPAGISMMGAAWDSFGGRHNANAARDRDAASGRGGKSSQPFAYSGSSLPRSPAERAAFVAFLAERMAEARRVCKPGGFALVWALPRTSHWTATAVEDAGWEIRDVVVHARGQGFPKSFEVSRKLYQDARVCVCEGRSDVFEPACGSCGKPVVPPGQGTALKPACEHWVLARNPSPMSFSETLLTTGVGTLNIDACRVGFSGHADEEESKGKNRHADFGSGPMTNQVYGRYARDRGNYDAAGRFPPNFVLSHSPGCVRSGEKTVRGSNQPGRSDGTTARGIGFDGRPGKTRNATFHTDPESYGRETVELWSCVEGCPVRLLGEQSGRSTSTRAKPRSAAHGEGFGMTHTGAEYDDAGTAARFYPNFEPDYDPFFYCPLASTAERNAGLAGFEERPRGDDADRFRHRINTSKVSDGGLRSDLPRANRHPTVKATRLCEWLARLITPPGGTVLDPFMGSGSVGVAAVRQGYSFVGVERDEGYMAVAKARIDHALPPIHERSET